MLAMIEWLELFFLWATISQAREWKTRWKPTFVSLKCTVPRFVCFLRQVLLLRREPSRVPSQTKTTPLLHLGWKAREKKHVHVMTLEMKRQFQDWCPNILAPFAPVKSPKAFISAKQQGARPKIPSAILDDWAVFSLNQVLVLGPSRSQLVFAKRAKSKKSVRGSSEAFAVCSAPGRLVAVDMNIQYIYSTWITWHPLDMILLFCMVVVIPRSLIHGGRWAIMSIPNLRFTFLHCNYW